MLYKTIVLGLLEQNPELHEQLRKEQKMLSALNHYSMELKKSHQAWKDRLLQAKPGSDESQIASEAQEIALKELEELLLRESPQDEDESISLGGAMESIRQHIPPE